MLSPFSKFLSSRRAIWASEGRGQCVLDCLGPTGTPGLMSCVVVTLRECCELREPWFLHLSKGAEEGPNETWTNILSRGRGVLEELQTLLLHLAWRCLGKLCRKLFPDSALPGKLGTQVFGTFLSPQGLSRWSLLGYQRSQGPLSLPSFLFFPSPTPLLISTSSCIPRVCSRVPEHHSLGRK